MWKVISRTIHGLWLAGSLVMEGLGIYYDVSQAIVAPIRPWGWPLWAWGIIAFTIFSASVILQLWYKVAKYNVLVNAVAPTIVKTDLTRTALTNPDYAKQMMSRIPLGKWAMPEDIVGATVFFASKASDFITGQILTLMVA